MSKHRALVSLKTEMRAALDAEKDRRRRKQLREEYEARLKSLEGEEEEASIPELRTQPTGEWSKAELKKEKRKRKEEAERQQLEKRLASTDLSGVEEEKLASLLHARQPDGFTLVDVRADGSCLFHALAHQLNLVQEPATPHTGESVRTELITWIETNPEKYQPFLEEPVAVVCERLRGGNAFGGEIEIQAAAERFGVAVQVYTADSGVIDYGLTEHPCLRLVFYKHKYATPHYVSLRSSCASSCAAVRRA